MSMPDVYKQLAPGSFIKVGLNKQQKPVYLGFVTHAGVNSVDAYVFIPGLPHPQYITGIVFCEEPNELGRPVFSVVPNPLEDKVAELDERIRQLERRTRSRNQLCESDTNPSR